jgi:hypothetical protein
VDNSIIQAELILAQADLRQKIKESKELYDGYNKIIQSSMEAKLRIKNQIEQWEKLL